MKSKKFKKASKVLNENYNKEDINEFMFDLFRVFTCSDEFKDYSENEKQIYFFMYRDTTNLLNTIGLDKRPKLVQKLESKH